MYDFKVTTDDLGRYVSYSEYPSNVMLRDEQGKPVIPTRHTANGHIFDDSNEFELPHYHGPKGEHLTFLNRELP